MLVAQGILRLVRGKDGHISWTNYHTRVGYPVGACSDIVVPGLGVPQVLPEVAGEVRVPFWVFLCNCPQKYGNRHSLNNHYIRNFWATIPCLP